ITLSPDGRWLLFQVVVQRSRDAGVLSSDQVWIARTDGGSMRCLGEVPHSRLPADRSQYLAHQFSWERDSRRISYIYQGSLYETLAVGSLLSPARWEVRAAAALAVCVRAGGRGRSIRPDPAAS